jgi:ribosome maturation factor RimP
MGPAERVRELVEPLLSDSDIELVDVEVGRGLIRLSLDRPGGIDLEAISTVSPSLSAALDAEDVVPGSYQLEVSSPGVERPLRTPEHFRRFTGSQVAVRTVPGTDGERRVAGTLEAADEEGITVAGRRIPYPAIERARTVFEWGPAPKPGRPGSSPSKSARTQKQTQTQKQKQKAESV